MTAGVGARPGGKVRQMFAERRRTVAGAEIAGVMANGDAGGSPVGWDKSYPLKPVGGGGGAGGGGGGGGGGNHLYRWVI